jgi:hypothetical protein
VSNVNWKARAFDTLFVLVTSGFMWQADTFLGVGDALEALPKWRVLLHLGLNIGWGILIHWWITDFRRRFEETKKAR